MKSLVGGRQSNFWQPLTDIFCQDAIFLTWRPIRFLVKVTICQDLWNWQSNNSLGYGELLRIDRTILEKKTTPLTSWLCLTKILLPSYLSKICCIRQITTYFFRPSWCDTTLMDILLRATFSLSDEWTFLPDSSTDADILSYMNKTLARGNILSKSSTDIRWIWISINFYLCHRRI